MLKDLIRILQTEYGMTVKEAKRYLKEADKEAVELIIDGFKNNAKTAFYND